MTSHDYILLMWFLKGLQKRSKYKPKAVRENKHWKPLCASTQGIEYFTMTEFLPLALYIFVHVALSKQGRISRKNAGYSEGCGHAPMYAEGGSADLKRRCVSVFST